MKVVLIQNIENVGKAGEVKEVADGFARNFLIPNGLAESATKANVSKAADFAQQEKKRQKDELGQIQKNAQKIDGQEIFFKVKAEGSKLFGSIDKKEIAGKLSEQGLELGQLSIALDAPIKEIGEYPVKVNFNHGIEVGIKVIVEKE